MLGKIAVLGNDTDRILGDFLRDNKIIDMDAYTDTLNASKLAGKGVIGMLIEKGHINESDIAKSFASVFGFDIIPVTAEMVQARPFKDKITSSFIQKKRVLPVQLDGNVLTVAISDPSGLRFVSELKLMTGKTIRTVVTELSVFDMPLDTAYTASPVNKSAAPALGIKPKNDVERYKAEASGSDVIDFVNNLFIDAISHGVSDIHIESFRDASRVRFRKYGVLEDQTEYAEFLHFNYSAVVTRIKILASLDISERRLPQDGAISTDLTETLVDIRVSVLPTAHGERVVMRILDQSNANIGLDHLGMDANVLQGLKKAINAPQGMILVTGPTGSGKSTTLYAILKELNKTGVNILTAEDPVEYDLTGIGQVQVREDIGLTFAAALRSFLRQDPEVIMIGEIRDKETSDMAIKASLTGHMVLSTLHTNDAPSSITRLINMGVPSYLITAALSMVVAQRLARTICPHCKIEHSTAKEELIALGFSETEVAQTKTFSAPGCDKCNDTGISGRMAIHEVLTVTPEMREIVLKGATDAELRALAKKQGFITMQERAREMISKGIISLEEYKRILILE